jgi:hypothetical protein
MHPTSKVSSSNNQTQSSIKQWTVHRPLIPNTLIKPTIEHSTSSHSHPHQVFMAHLEPFGTPMPNINHTHFLRVCAQNTQHDFKLFGDGLEMHNLINNLKLLGASMFVPISPNVNWKNSSSWVQTKQLFHPHFNQIHLSATSSNIGNDPLYMNKHLVGGSAILTFGLWSSKVSFSPLDESGHGIFSITTIQGKGKRCISFISAYIAVSKGADIGTESLFVNKLHCMKRRP